MLYEVAAVAFAAPLVMAYPQAATQVGDTGNFLMTARHDGFDPINNKPINANAQGLWIGKPTTSQCPNEIIYCSGYPGNTTLAGSSGTGIGYLAVASPGGQQLYVAPDGVVGFTLAHSLDMPKGSETIEWTYTAPTSEGAYGTLQGPGGFFACPVDATDIYQIKALVGGRSGYEGCYGIHINAIPASQISAWEYT